MPTLACFPLHLCGVIRVQEVGGTSYQEKSAQSLIERTTCIAYLEGSQAV